MMLLTFICLAAILPTMDAYLQAGQASGTGSGGRYSDAQEMAANAKYPGYFWTEDQHAAFAQVFQAELEANTTEVPIDTDTGSGRSQGCDFQCREPQQGPYGRKRRSETPVEDTVARYQDLLGNSQADTPLAEPETKNREKRQATTPLGKPVFHGCCISRHTFISPETAKNIRDVDVRVVQFNNRRQFFTSWDCVHAQACQGCTCLREMNMLTAVVENRDFPANSDQEFVLEFIKITGCCKCFNISP